ncbi:ABC transporter substrate-binding protein [Micromonospora endolithica]|uniref:Extracellular solute-binding protein n=1 Tax=Micromonospora endolithica TaxID=230091 RepID=A0A3A9Z0Z7_9ACTN|nr:extracellular solute-binding protein [Micromonospora endolithica]RKN41057.1 extracellular solute-binding protein [Micromonospora endolithica]TWJ24278.1 carbohydrate ABC transporter substrate-binding protein (CUT1 family) [Micromonospora endolithica]
MTHLISTGMSRRQAIQLGLGAGLTVALTACGEDGTPTSASGTSLGGASLTGLMRASFIPAIHELQQKQAATWAEAHDGTVELTFAKEWREQIAAVVESRAGEDLGELFANQAHIYADRLVDVTELCESIGDRNGGWYDVAKEACVVDGRWRAIPRAYTAHVMNWRTDLFGQVGFTRFPSTWTELVEAATRLRDAKLPRVALTMSQAGPNDSASVAYSLLWSYGATEVEADGKTVAINSSQTREAVKLMQELAAVSAPEISSYDEGGNNTSFLAGKIAVTQNATSIWYTAQKQAPDIAKNMSHARYPRGPVGHQQLVEMNSLAIFAHSKRVEPAKAFYRYLMESEQLTALAEAALTYYTPLLKGYDDLRSMPWNSEPKLDGLRGLAAGGHMPGWPGPASRQSAQAYNNQTVVNMFARVISGKASAEESIRTAEDELKKVYEG